MGVVAGYFAVFIAILVKLCTGVWGHAVEVNDVAVNLDSEIYRAIHTFFGLARYTEYKWGYGPYLDGIFSQSNYGICVKMGIWLMPEPEDFHPFAITFTQYEDLPDLVDTLRPLRLANVIPNSCSIAPSYGEDYAGVWNIYAALYGTSEQIKVNWNIVKSKFSKLCTKL